MKWRYCRFMTRPPDALFDPKLDLLLERVVDVPRALVWRAWTTPELLKKWFVPRPWQVIECEVDLRPGGIFRTMMQSPEGEKFPTGGCYLEVVENERLVWTEALGPGFRPQEKNGEVPTITAILTFTDEGAATKYTAHVLHQSPEAREQHETLGFFDGWNAALDQMVEMIQAMR